jgi:hypothetical protein
LFRLSRQFIIVIFIFFFTELEQFLIFGWFCERKIRRFISFLFAQLQLPRVCFRVHSSFVGVIKAFIEKRVNCEDDEKRALEITRETKSKEVTSNCETSPLKATFYVFMLALQAF